MTRLDRYQRQHPLTPAMPSPKGGTQNKLVNADLADANGPIVRFERQTDPLHATSCTGSVIDAQPRADGAVYKLLTAAHCVSGDGSFRNLRTDTGAFAYLEMNIDRVLLPPEYKCGTTGFDAGCASDAAVVLFQTPQRKATLVTPLAVTGIGAPPRMPGVGDAVELWGAGLPDGQLRTGESVLRAINARGYLQTSSDARNPQPIMTKGDSGGPLMSAASGRREIIGINARGTSPTAEQCGTGPCAMTATSLCTNLALPHLNNFTKNAMTTPYSLHIASGRIATHETTILSMPAMLGACVLVGLAGIVGGAALYAYKRYTRSRAVTPPKNEAPTAPNANPA